jgi:hypothetical protein
MHESRTSLTVTQLPHPLLSLRSSLVIDVEPLLLPGFSHRYTVSAPGDCPGSRPSWLTSNDCTSHARSILRMVRDDLLALLPKDINEGGVDPVGKVGVFLVYESAYIASSRNLQHSRCTNYHRHRPRNRPPSTPSY